MKDKDEILERYYRGESTVEEERSLKKAFRQGELADEPMLAFSRTPSLLQPELREKIRQNLHRRQQRRMSRWWITAGSIAAGLVLLIALRDFIPQTPPEQMQLSDNLKKERFEDALRVIGNVLEEEKPSVQRVLYEDHNLIISVE